MLPPTQAHTFRLRQPLDGDVGLDAWVGVVTDDFEVFELVVIDRRRLTLDHQFRQLLRRARQLGLDLFHVVAVGVGVAGGDDDLVGDQVALLGQHVGQQRQRGGVVRQAKPFHATHIMHTTIAVFSKVPCVSECIIIIAHYACKNKNLTPLNEYFL